MTLSIADRAEALVARQPAQALRLLEDGARRGDADALFTLGIWRLEGRYAPRDLALARTLFGHAAKAGRGDVLAIYIAFVANGTGGAADWAEAMRLLAAFARTDAAARQQHDLIAAMRLMPDGAPDRLPPREPISDRPAVIRIRGLFSAAECTYLARAAEPMLAQATVVDPRSGRLILDPVRTSDHAAFPLALENPAIHALNRRLAAASGTAVTQGEPLQILSYRPGQQYRAHHDALPGVANQRILTMLVYLNDDYTGGETRFLAPGLDVRGAPGDAILFRNADAVGRPDPAAQHAGLPVLTGRKLIASRWIRANPLDLGDKKPAAR